MSRLLYRLSYATMIYSEDVNIAKGVVAVKAAGPGGRPGLDGTRAGLQVHKTRRHGRVIGRKR
jgi:hypothetical protein